MGMCAYLKRDACTHATLAHATYMYACTCMHMHAHTCTQASAPITHTLRSLYKAMEPLDTSGDKAMGMDTYKAMEPLDTSDDAYRADSSLIPEGTWMQTCTPEEGTCMQTLSSEMPGRAAFLDLHLSLRREGLFEGTHAWFAHACA